MCLVLSNVSYSDAIDAEAGSVELICMYVQMPLLVLSLHEIVIAC